MGLPETPQERIRADAVQSDVKNMNKNWEYRTGYREGYIAGATAEHERAQQVIDALDQFISYHETGLLPAKHVYEKAVAARKQWKGEGKEVGDESK